MTSPRNQRTRIEIALCKLGPKGRSAPWADCRQLRAQAQRGVLGRAGRNLTPLAQRGYALFFAGVTGPQRDGPKRCSGHGGGWRRCGTKAMVEGRRTFLRFLMLPISKLGAAEYSVTTKGGPALVRPVTKRTLLRVETSPPPTSMELYGDKETFMRERAQASSAERVAGGWR